MALSVSEVLVTSLISTVILQEARFIIFFFPGKEKKEGFPSAVQRMKLRGEEIHKVLNVGRLRCGVTCRCRE